MKLALLLPFWILFLFLSSDRDFSKETVSLIFLCWSAVLLCISKKPQRLQIFLFVCFLKYCEFAYTVCAVPVIIPLTARKEDAQNSKDSGWKLCPSLPGWAPDETGCDLFDSRATAVRAGAAPKRPPPGRWVLETATLWAAARAALKWMLPDRWQAGHRNGLRCLAMGVLPKRPPWVADLCVIETVWRGGGRSVTRMAAGRSLKWASLKWWPVSRRQMHRPNGCRRVADVQVFETVPGRSLSRGSLKQPPQLWRQLSCCMDGSERGLLQITQREGVREVKGNCYVWKCESPKNDYVWSFWFKSVLVSRPVKCCWVLETPDCRCLHWSQRFLYVTEGKQEKIACIRMVLII